MRIKVIYLIENRFFFQFLFSHGQSLLRFLRLLALQQLAFILVYYVISRFSSIRCLLLDYCLFMSKQKFVHSDDLDKITLRLPNSYWNGGGTKHYPSFQEYETLIFYYTYFTQLHINSPSFILTPSFYYTYFIFNISYYETKELALYKKTIIKLN